MRPDATVLEQGVEHMIRVDYIQAFVVRRERDAADRACGAEPNRVHTSQMGGSGGPPAGQMGDPSERREGRGGAPKSAICCPMA